MSGDKKVSYREFLDHAIRIGEILKQKYSKKSKCTILCSDQFNTALCILSCWYAQLVPIPMSMNYGYDHCKGIVEVIEPRVMLSDDFELCKKFNLSSFNIVNSEVIGEENDQVEEEALLDVALIMCTSGTTGKPKGVIIEEDGLTKNVEAIKEYFMISEEDVILIARPLYHCAVLTGEFLISLINGVNIIFASGSYNPFMILSMLKKYSITVLGGTPSLFLQLALCNRKGQNESKLRVIALSGECLVKEVANKIRESFKSAEIYNVYGLTEASPRVSYLPPEQFARIPESVGIGLKDTYIKIVDSAGAECEVNQPGDIIVHSPSIMKGYYRNDDLTRQKIQNHWLRTGDIGYKDKDGYLFILSRSDDMIIKAGMNIYPRQIENRVNELKEVKECVVYRVQMKSSQVIGIDLVMENESIDMTKKQILQLFQNILEEYEMPTYVTVVDKLKRNASGKLLRLPKTEKDFETII